MERPCRLGEVIGSSSICLLGLSQLSLRQLISDTVSRLMVLIINEIRVMLGRWKIRLCLILIKLMFCTSINYLGAVINGEGRGMPFFSFRDNLY